MVSNRICVCWHKYIRMIIYLFTLFASTSIFTAHEGFMAEGRAIPALTDEAPKKGMEDLGLMKESKAQIGSRPPKCEGRCRSCGRCEAVQVPVIPQVQSHGGRTRTATHSAARAILPHSRVDDLSNYKPMSWKCKCGNYLFNP